ncbi:beta-amyrin 28-monooxygenase-like [Andrographis paniculata]|uniref:beta-amyrin 28-monooxygenase-like n=1 Tax=Andrographis paniculata TaxID=175694 RepID=UPI0021E8DC16|nr:beta-amyrin 28-monooxygenase-like [Andrographis paniculata]
MEGVLLAVAASLAVFALTIAYYISFRRSSCRANLPPGSFGWPIIGESIEFLFGKPEKFVGDRMRKYSPEIFKTKIFGEKTAVLCGPKGNKFIFTNEQKYFTSFRPHSMQHLFRSYKTKAAAQAQAEAEAQAQRQSSDESKMIRQPGFLKPEALMRYLRKMDSISRQQLAIHWSGKEIVQVYPMAKTLTLTLASHFFLGVNNPERIARLVKYFDDITVGMHSIMLNIPGTVFYRANKAAAFIRKELVDVIQEKKQAMADHGSPPMRDILSHLIAMAMTTTTTGPAAAAADYETADKIMGLLTAGYSTVATTITFLMKYVGLHPEIYEKVRAEQMEVALAASKKGEGEVLLEWEDMNRMKYSWNVVCETMRMVPPLQGMMREVSTEFSFGGHTVPKGWKVYWTVSTTNKNPDYFKDPERFNPSRYDEDGEAPPPYTNVPFGGGPRMCPGKEYARLAILAFLHNAVRRYKWQVLDPHEKVDGDMMPAPQNGLPIRLINY